MRNKKRKGLYLILVIFLAFFLSLSAYYLYTPIDLTNYKNLLLPEIEKAAHLNIELEGLVLTILPYPRLSFRGLTIKEGGYAVFKAESIKASLALIPLIVHKEFEVKNLVITGTDVFVKREADGGLNIIRILKETYIPVSIKKVRIKTGKAHWTDEFLQGGIKYEAVNIDATLIPKGADDFSYYGTAKLLPSTRIKFS
ncbi:MAG: AsmA family protein, partial [Deltaproteobacteria bacterium]|nr:AsmA family protein [Deltaproteobacteria bacterium]